MNTDWKDTGAEGVPDKITLGILETEEGDMYLRVTEQLADPTEGNPENQTWIPAMVEHWDFGNRTWNIDNGLHQDMNKNQFTVFDDAAEFQAFLVDAQSDYDKINPPKGANDGPGGTKGQS